MVENLVSAKNKPPRPAFPSLCRASHSRGQLHNIISLFDVLHSRSDHGSEAVEPMISILPSTPRFSHRPLISPPKIQYPWASNTNWWISIRYRIVIPMHAALHYKTRRGSKIDSTMMLRLWVSVLCLASLVERGRHLSRKPVVWEDKA
jgi:hypothetical protein